MLVFNCNVILLLFQDMYICERERALHRQMSNSVIHWKRHQLSKAKDEMSLGNPFPPSLGNHCFEISYCGTWQVKFHHYKLDWQTFLPHHAHKSTCASLSCALRMAWSRSIRCGHDITMHAWTNLATHGTAFRKGLQKKWMATVGNWLMKWELNPGNPGVKVDLWHDTTQKNITLALFSSGTLPAICGNPNTLNSPLFCSRRLRCPPNLTRFYYE